MKYISPIYTQISQKSVLKFMKSRMFDQNGFDSIVPYDVSSAYSQFAEPDHYGTCRKS